MSGVDVAAWWGALPVATRAVLLLQLAAHAALLAGGLEPCLDLEAVLLRGAWSRLFTFLFVSPSGALFGLPSLAVQCAAWVAVGRIAEHGSGSAALLSRFAVLAALNVASVLIFSLFGAVVVLAVWLLPVPTGVLAGAAEKLPVVHLCPSGLSGVIAALALVELADKWVSVGHHMLPGFFAVIVIGTLLFPIGGFSLLLLHELGWISGLLYVMVLSHRLPQRSPQVAAMLNGFHGFVADKAEVSPEELVDEASVSVLAQYAYRSIFALQRSPFIAEPEERHIV